MRFCTHKTDGSQTTLQKIFEFYHNSKIFLKIYCTRFSVVNKKINGKAKDTNDTNNFN